MQIGVIGLGRMGGNIVRRLTRAGHSCVVYDADPGPGAALAKDGATAVDLGAGHGRGASGAAHRLGDAARGQDHRRDDQSSSPA